MLTLTEIREQIATTVEARRQLAYEAGLRAGQKGRGAVKLTTAAERHDYTDAEVERIRAAGLDPSVLARTRNAQTFTEWKRLRDGGAVALTAADPDGEEPADPWEKEREKALAEKDPAIMAAIGDGTIRSYSDYLRVKRERGAA